jgi:hypothetical protein
MGFVLRDNLGLKGQMMSQTNKTTRTGRAIEAWSLLQIKVMQAAIA